MKSIRHTFAVLTAFLFIVLNSGLASAQDSVKSFNSGICSKKDSIRRAELIVPRPALQPVKSMINHEGDPIDTLCTEVEHIKVILYNDNTWKYVKDESYIASEDIFNEYWDNFSTNPYQVTKDKLPESTGIWLIDDMSDFHCPYQGDVYYRGKFGVRRGHRHLGVDIPLKTGSPIYATFNGKVRVSKTMRGYGNIVIIRHENGLETFHGHLSKRLVESGDIVHAGDIIGLGGSTGRSTGPHLHYETRYYGYAFDPQWLIDFKEGTLRRRIFMFKKKYLDIHRSYEQNFDDEIANEEEDKKEDAEREAMRWHTIKSGDTLGRIAINNGTTVKAICRLNGITPKTILKIGRKIRVR